MADESQWRLTVEERDTRTHSENQGREVGEEEGGGELMKRTNLLPNFHVNGRHVWSRHVDFSRRRNEILIIIQFSWFSFGFLSFKSLDGAVIQIQIQIWKIERNCLFFAILLASFKRRSRS